MNIQILQFKLNSILKQNKAKKSKLATHWRIEPSRLAHYKTSNLLFSQPIPDTWKEYKCTFLLDVSYSMWGKQLWDTVITLQNLIKLFYWIIDFNIVAFWYGSFWLTAREVLSLDPNKIYNLEYQEDKLRRTTSIKEFNWEKVLTTYDWGNFRWTEYATLWDLAVKKAWEDLLSESWEKFIVLLTDWENNCDSEREEFTNICWTTPQNSNADYKRTIREIKSNWIDILPISIWYTNLSEYYNDVITLTDPKEVYDDVIKFIDKNFWENY